MEKTLHKRIKLVSFLAMILFSLGIIAGIILLRSGKFEIDFGIDDFLITWVVLMVFPVMSIITSYAIYHTEKTYIKKVAKLVFYVYPMILILTTISIIELDSVLVILVVAVLIISFTIIALLHILVFANASKLASSIAFAILLIIGILLKRYHIMYSGLFIALVLVIFLLSSFMFGIRCLYLGEKNKYFKNVAFWGSFIITLFFMGLMWKLQHWPAANLIMYTSNILLPLATIVFLFTLPSSGFVEWKTLYKRVLIRILIPWTLIFLLFILRYLLPEVHNIIWSRDVPTVNYGFDMPDYSIELKKNIEEQ